jgi:hypothetical protein
MPIYYRTPIERQVSWRIVAGIVVSGLFALLCFLAPLYAVINARGGGPIVWGAVLVAFYCVGVALLFACRRGVAELRSRIERRDEA